MENKKKLTKKQIALIVVLLVVFTVVLIFLPYLVIFLALGIMVIGELTGHNSLPK